MRVPAEDAGLLRFLWWPNGDLSQELVDFRMMVHLFGTTSSPSCANIALKRCAEDSFVRRPSRNFYTASMWMTLVSTASEEEALYQDLVSICSKGGFQRTKWMSNRRSVMATIPGMERAKDIKDIKDLELDHDLLPVESVRSTMVHSV